MTWTMLVCALLASPPVEQSAPQVEAAVAVARPLRYRLAAGVNLGFVHLVGVQATATVFAAGRPRFDVDLLWEPSVFLQSYSVGGAWHPFDRIFFVGVRARLMQWHFPGTRGYVPERDNQFGLGFEGGLRAPIAAHGRLLFNLSVGGTWVVTAGAPVQGLLNLTAGVAWGLIER